MLAVHSNSGIGLTMRAYVDAKVFTAIVRAHRADYPVPA